MDRLHAALPLPVGGNVRHALKEKAQAHDTHLKAVSVKLDGLRQQLASLPVEDLTSRTKVVSDVGLEALKHMLSWLKLDCKKLKKPASWCDACSSTWSSRPPNKPTRTHPEFCLRERLRRLPTPRDAVRCITL